MRYQITGETMAVVTGPGRVVPHTMPIGNFAGAVASVLPSN